MKVCIIGNGPSNILYKNNKIDYDFKVCCNIPQHGYKRDCTSIVDIRTIRIIKRSVELNKPINLGQIWCHQDMYKLAKRNKLPGIWNPIYESRRTPVKINGKEYSVDYNSGLAAADYVCENYDDLEEVHLWGFDSLFSQDFNSQMDNLVIREQRNAFMLNQVWNHFWKQVLDKYPNVTFKANIPLGTNLKEPYSSYKNFIPVHH